MSSQVCSEDVMQLPVAQVMVTSTSADESSVQSMRTQSSTACLELGRQLQAASRAGDTATVIELMAKGAPFTTDWLGTSALHWAAAQGHAETCGVLVRAGVSRDARTKVERTPLHLAAHAGHHRVVALLLAHGAPPDCRDMLLMTPLHWAAAQGHEDTARALLLAGADRSLRCKFGKTPRDLALRHNHPHLVRLLDDYTAEQTTEENVSQAEDETKMAEASAGMRQAGGSAGEGAAVRLLRRHGITMLPPDRGSTVLTALQSGRTVALSDAGRLLLQESGAQPRPPRPLKVLRLAGQHYQPVKVVQVRAGAKPPVKIVLKRDKYSRLAGGAEAPAAVKQEAAEEGEAACACGERCPARRQLAEARALIASLRAQLAAAQHAASPLQ